MDRQSKTSQTSLNYRPNGSSGESVNTDNDMTTNNLNNSDHDYLTAVPLQTIGEASPTRLTPLTPASPAPSSTFRQTRPTIADRRQPSIRLRRLASSTALRPDQRQSNQSSGLRNNISTAHDAGGNRRRSSSEPQRMQWSDSSGHLGPDSSRDFAPTNNGRPRRTSSPMRPIDEEVARDYVTYAAALDGDVPQEGPRRPGFFSRASNATLSAFGYDGNPDRRTERAERTERRRQNRSQSLSQDEYEHGLVDFLDVVDPEIATLSTLTNVQNSLFVPDLGHFLNRRPTYTFTRDPSVIPEIDTDPPTETDDDDTRPVRPELERSVTITSELGDADDGHYAVLPHGISLKGWSAAEKEELNDHVRHLMHSRRAAFKRSMKGFGQYVRRPLGFFVTLYAFLITSFGLLWVLFLIGWISVGGKKDYVTNIIDNILVALFAIIGDGLAPFRAVDTYHMIFIAHYHHLTWKLRKKRNLPDLEDHNDLPGLQPKEVESSDGANFVSDEDRELVVLTPVQQAKLKHHQEKFAKSHTFYKPHETATHRAFPLRLLVAIVVLLDCHSLFQIALGTCTWSISYHVRPFALTTVILCCSLTCNITGGILISIGDKRTRKKEVVERMFRQQLTEQAMRKIEKRRAREQRRNSDLDQAVELELEPVTERTSLEISDGDDQLARDKKDKRPVEAANGRSGAAGAADMGEVALPTAATASVAGAY